MHTPFLFADALLSWYDHQARILPWRVAPSESTHKRPDPYAVWLSESMLQQTTVKSVIAYFHKFLTLWPTITDLANADRDDVLTAWAGLGYYARARNLHMCAKIVVEQYNGQFPETEQALRTLPGIGMYTAAAISSMAFGRRAVVVDGNIERIISRYFALETVLPAGKPIIYAHTDLVTPQERAGDFAQAMMDVGATVCTPRSPQCLLCPLQKGCKAFAQGTMTEYPRKAPKKTKPVRKAWVFIIQDAAHGDLFIQQRPDKGLLGGMWEFPSSPWTETLPSSEEAQQFLKEQFSCAIMSFQILDGCTVKHTFTHFDLFLYPIGIIAEQTQENTSVWVTPPDLGNYALPTLMRKVWETTANVLQKRKTHDLTPT